ncbi:hypothetical protein MB02_15545 [Croceicoccus estronivorus]|nr:hypothetical protein MB02_15545 [Croceicoccus estronivorus]
MNGAPAADEAAPKRELNAAEMFAFADAARDRGDYDTARAAYRALTLDPAIDLRTEARFRLGMMLADKQGKYREAAVEFRKILDERPETPGVRLQLARMQAQLGNLSAARRELRAVRASGLPPEVDQIVRFYANALESLKRVGGSFEVALAPSNNINRATRADTLGTIIGDFTLDDDAKAKSGTGLSLKGQAYGRVPLSHRLDLLARVSGDTDLYRHRDFNDIALSAQMGPQWRSGRDRLSLAGLAAWRWYGGDPYSFTYGVTGNWLHPTGKRSQVRLDGSVVRIDNRRNDLEDATRYMLAGTVERAFSARAGGGIQLSAQRSVARDPGYSGTRGGMDAFLFREFGKTTVVLNVGYSRLTADQRLFLYPRLRKDNRYSASIAATFRSLRIGSIAPLARLKYEYNRSSVEIYDFNRVAAELGITAAF